MAERESRELVADQAREVARGWSGPDADPSWALVAALFDAHADASAGERTVAAPVKLLHDRNTLKLLTAFKEISDRGIRHRLVSLVDTIARAKPKASR